MRMCQEEQECLNKISLMQDRQKVNEISKQLSAAMKSASKTNRDLLQAPDATVADSKEKMLREDMNSLEREFGYKKKLASKNSEQDLVKLAKDSHSIQISKEFAKAIKSKELSSDRTFKLDKNVKFEPVNIIKSIKFSECTKQQELLQTHKDTKNNTNSRTLADKRKKIVELKQFLKQPKFCLYIPPSVS